MSPRLMRPWGELLAIYNRMLEALGRSARTIKSVACLTVPNTLMLVYLLLCSDLLPEHPKYAFPVN